MKMVHVLFGSIAAAAAVAVVSSFSGSPPPSREPAGVVAESAAAGDRSAAGDAHGADSAPAAAIAGEVLEAIDVPGYTYLRVGAKGSDGTWAAVPTAAVKVGASVSVVGAMKMTDFQSKALGRTFPAIYFGNLGDARSAAASAGGENPHAAGADPHAGVPGAPAMGADPHAGVPGAPAMGADPHAGVPGAPAMGADPHAGVAGAPAIAADPHSGIASPGAAAVDVKAVPRAEGANGKTVAEIIGQRAALSGKTVRLRGTVVKATGGVLGRSFVHLRDGSGDAAAATNDLTVTMEAKPEVGDTVVIEGVVALDRDIGSGYKYSTIVEEAKLIKQ